MHWVRLKFGDKLGVKCLCELRMRAAQIFFETFCVKQSLRRKCEKEFDFERCARHLFELTVCDDMLLTLQFVHEENVTIIRWGKDVWCTRRADARRESELRAGQTACKKR